ncbi:transcription factor TFIIB repeat-containing domain protein [Ancylostoma caninum]|uniref:Transcription factor TFIIB repeat-containing domain protein n=1 Tax=Ancylostoma caninum TaxID=29170 RepID=A0A368GIP9_ANCCA|nr:transcription factor TFIIB repeat-containing domain protein [Ancylostoma caninum]
MSVSRNLTRGRVRSHVVVACLYMTCRLENTAHLLLDFSDVTQVNVFDLGRTLSFLSRSLRINLPSTDPCLYIMRFACLLEFGEKQKEVVNLATRLVQRMKRDWMSTGRRPTGLCGAALLLAARSFNFNRTISDVVKVVHISESVVRKRLEEFSQTPSGALTIDEFSTVDLEHCEDPPAFREARRKAREEQLAKEAEMAAEMEKEVIPIEEELERALEKKRREKFKQTRYAKLVADDPEVGTAEEALVRDEVMDTVYRAVDEDDRPETNNYRQYGPSLQSLGITQSPSTANGVSTLSSSAPLPPQDWPDGSLDLTGIDDDEIDSYILTSRESEVKERFWMKLNGEHLKEMERRRKEREEEEAKEKDNPTKKKRRRVVPHRQNLASNTAIEAMEKIIHEKKLSNKVNYEILKEIEHTASGLDSFDKEKSQAQVIKNVNELVSTLGMDTAIPAEDSTSSLGRVVPLTPENMTRREREISRRNKPLKDPTALRNAFKIEPASSADAGSQSQEFKRPIPLNRSRYGRLGGVRPNLASAGLHRSIMNHSAQQSEATESEADKPSNIGSLFVKTEVFLDTKAYPLNSANNGEVAAIDHASEADKPSNIGSLFVKTEVFLDTKAYPLNSANNGEVAAIDHAGTSPTEPSSVENSTSTPSHSGDSVPAQPATDEFGEEAPTTSVNGSNLLTRAKRMKPRIPKPASTLEQSNPTQEATSESDEIEVVEESVMSTSEQVELAGNLLRRCRRPLIKPRVEPSPSDSPGGEKSEVISSTNQGGLDSDATSTAESSTSNLLRRGRKPMLKPIIAPSTAKKEESSTSEGQEQLEKSAQGETTLLRGRRLLVKPKLPPAQKDGETSRDNADKTCNQVE